ncbi:protein phosphatase PTC7 homolog [Drosophila eugracilis]|uniref:protein phosphatase PTC7 homolog n=1 Tax=Drosophila eugracilis TaxID=29029 RepID=UPI0007E66AB2|nr:protein phosphatase PTC7 homolog [Drosophila eugracilis]
MDVDCSGSRRTIRRTLIKCCEQLLDIVLAMTYGGSQFLRRLWGLNGRELPQNDPKENGDGWMFINQHNQRHNSNLSAQKEVLESRSSGADGDFLGIEGKSETRPLELVSVVCGFAKDSIINRRGKFGEDAWFMSSNSEAYTMGVADGVGGWRNYGVDPGKFSMFLMRSCERLSCLKDFEPERPHLLLERAYCDLLKQESPIVGSCTACVLTFNRRNSTLYTANIGDSGFLVVRSGSVVCRSQEQQHCFNTPYQLASPPPGHDVNVISDGPDTVDRIQFPMELGDVILLATDGLYDNVPESFLIEVLTEMSGISDPVRLQMFANALAFMARILSLNPKHDSPFSQNARKMNIELSGGKPDDITVLLATIV